MPTEKNLRTKNRKKRRTRFESVKYDDRYQPENAVTESFDIEAPFQEKENTIADTKEENKCHPCKILNWVLLVVNCCSIFTLGYFYFQLKLDDKYGDDIRLLRKDYKELRKEMSSPNNDSIDAKSIDKFVICEELVDKKFIELEENRRGTEVRATVEDIKNESQRETENGYYKRNDSIIQMILGQMKNWNIKNLDKNADTADYTLFEILDVDQDGVLNSKDMKVIDDLGILHHYDQDIQIGDLLKKVGRETKLEKHERTINYLKQDIDKLKLQMQGQIPPEGIKVENSPESDGLYFLDKNPEYGRIKYHRKDKDKPAQYIFWNPKENQWTISEDLSKDTKSLVVGSSGDVLNPTLVKDWKVHNIVNQSITVEEIVILPE